MKLLIYALIMLFGGLILGTALILGQDNKAMVECNDWAIDIAIHPEHLGAYEQWQKDECAFYKIDLGATSTVTD